MSSHTIHPSYAQTDKALDHELARTTELSDEELAEALKVLSAHLSNHKTTEAIHDEIERLTNQALSINDTFDNLSRLLKSVADESKPDMKKDVEALEQRWKDHAHNYTTFLWNSRNVAGKAEATASDFATDFAEFLKDPEVTKEEKRTEMDNYLQKLDKDAASAKEASQSLADLRDGVKKFYRDWKALIKKYKPSTGNDDLAKDIAMLNTSLAIIRSKIDRLAKTMGVITASNGGSSILATLCPNAWTGIMTSALQTKGHNALTDATSEVQNLQRELDTKTAQRDAATARLTGTQAVNAELSLDDDMGITSVMTKLGALVSVWQTIRADITTIYDLLDHIEGGLPKQLFDLRLDTLASLYKAVAAALRHYQTTIQPPARTQAARGGF